MNIDTQQPQPRTVAQAVVEAGTYPQARRAPWPTRHDAPEAEQRVPDAVEVEEVAPCSS